MAREEIEIEISPTGKVTVRTKGIKGKKCLDVAESLVQLIGRLEDQQLTAEYYETSVEGEVQRRQEVRRRNG
jgi:hypothetical protein